MNKKEIEKRNKIIKILNDRIKTFENAWTFEKLEQEEKEKFYKIFTSEQLKNSLSGNNKQIITVLNMIYTTFLTSIGYNGYTWREKEKIPF